MSPDVLPLCCRTVTPHPVLTHNHHYMVINQWDQQINQRSHHLLEREGVISDGQPVAAAETPEHGIGDHQPQSGRGDLHDELGQNRWRHACSAKKKQNKNSFNDLKEMQTDLARTLQGKIDNTTWLGIGSFTLANTGQFPALVHTLADHCKVLC